MTLYAGWPANVVSEETVAVTFSLTVAFASEAVYFNVVA